MSALESAGHEEAGLEVLDVGHCYGRFVAARHIDLRVAPGEVHCLLGPSGSGKSTLLRLVAGLEKLQQGRITIAGQEVANERGQQPPERRAVGFVFQDYALFPHLDVRRNVLFGMEGRDPKSQRDAADALLAKVGMAGHASAMPHTLSGGQQQRVALARALAREPVVMLLDEPFSGLDVRLRAEIRASTLRVLRDAGVATLMVTHDPHEALVTGDVVSVIREGRLLRTAPPQEIYARSGSLEVAEIFGTVNRFTGTLREGRVVTPCGEIFWDEGDDGAGIDDGAEVEVLLRPESIRLHPVSHATEDLPEGRITEVLPGNGILEITVELPDGTRLHVHDLPRRTWKVGEVVAVEPVAGEAGAGASMVHVLGNSGAD
jgi:iron(III) transport system ATP-binding protein